jgi:hypothetical protein
MSRMMLWPFIMSGTVRVSALYSELSDWLCAIVLSVSCLFNLTGRELFERLWENNSGFIDNNECRIFGAAIDANSGIEQSN